MGVARREKKEASQSWHIYQEADARFRAEYDRYFRVGPSEVYLPVESLTRSALTELSALHAAREAAWDIAVTASERLFEETGGRWPNAGLV